MPELLDLVAVTDHGIVVTAVGEGGVPTLEEWHMHDIARYIASERLNSGNAVIERMSNQIACIGAYVVKYSLEPITTECKNPLGGHGHQRREGL